MKARTKSTNRNGSSLILSLRIAPASIKAEDELGLFIKVSFPRMALQWHIQILDMRFQDGVLSSRLSLARRNSVNGNRAPKRLRDARPECKSFQQRTQVQVRHGAYLRLQELRNAHMRVFCLLLRLELNRAYRHSNGAGLTKMLTAKWLEIRMLQRL
jgi:hypothetical protein